MQCVLLNYNIFHTPTGTYKQRSGLAMGSPLSSSISDIFLNLMETTFIEKFIKNKEILDRSRYIYDILVIRDKRHMICRISHYKSNGENISNYFEMK
jgi:hypothetical protein